ncbi:phosphate/phosphite/phosphonate ABC transporter substrate-binding protein [Paenibacillus spongiae]|uniref:Phosphate/phosphite/phosphonate ABC transporter substrate-binding protein n=1 Tax=Paenibacillus spongiae TaxID=2909671 RepID=A0ABY5S583_9BACL|nr:phosphate/phosphite/phosphonate ABC transporter substrate-binding protein [Paenibacillus spongiae]UVI29061.1 phosphate/phosphite/phosphonate ABC transporter substrate-binding protein [Paenibacillus spongiae]
MKRRMLFASLILVLLLTACSNAGNGGNDSSAKNGGGKGKNDAKETITIAWQPNESSGDLQETRDAIGKMIEEATGKKVEHFTTTDYIISIEALTNGSADIAYMGATSYVEAKKKNDNLVPLVVNSGESGTLDDASYYGWLAVRQEDEAQYKEQDAYSINNIAGKRFSFVSNSSTSGFKVPSNAIVSHFSKQDAYKDLTVEDLMEGGSGQFFSDVVYGGSHQGSAVNLLTKKADIAAFCDTCVGNYVELAEGEANRPGALYKVIEKAEQPFDKLAGEQFRLITVTPVLNGPFIANRDTISEEDFKAIVDIMTSEATAKNESIFLPEDSEKSGLFWKSGDAKFLPVEDAWYNPIRELSN